MLANKYYVDELYDETVVRGTWATARGLYKFDANVVDGMVNGSRHTSPWAPRFYRASSTSMWWTAW